MEFLNGVIEWLKTGLSQWGTIGEWFLYLLAHPWLLGVAWLGWTFIVWAWGEAKGWSATGPKWWKPFITTIGIALLLMFGVGLLFRYVPAYGQWLIQQARDGAAEIQPISPPDDNAPKATPAATQSGADTSPTQSSQSVTSQIACYKITDPTGATVRSGSTSSAPEVGTIPNGTVVKTDQTVESNTVGSTNLRARLAEAVNGIAAGNWFHLAAAQATTCP